MNKLNRLGELEEIAINRFCDKTDFDRVEWMTEEEKEEYLKLYKEEYGECLSCGDDKDCKH